MYLDTEPTADVSISRIIVLSCTAADTQPFSTSSNYGGGSEMSGKTIK